MDNTFIELLKYGGLSLKEGLLNSTFGNHKRYLRIATLDQ
jgi:hypothetical protein